MLRIQLSFILKISYLFICYAFICADDYTDYSYEYEYHDEVENPRPDLSEYYWESTDLAIWCSKDLRFIEFDSRFWLTCDTRNGTRGSDVWWTRNGSNLTSFVRNNDDRPGTSLLFIEATRDDTGNYTCWARTSEGNVLNKTIHVQVREPCIIRAEEYKVFVKPNESATLSCHVQGCPKLNYTWRSYNYEEFTYDEIKVSDEIMDISYINETYFIMTLHFTSVTFKKERAFICTICDAAVEKRAFIRLLVTEVPIVSIIDAIALGRHEVYLQWMVNERYSRLEKCLIQYMKKHTEQWQNYSKTIDVYQEQMIFEGLFENTSYRFRIRATNSVGDSAFAETEWVTTPEKDPKYTPIIWIEGTTLDSITIGCSAPPADLAVYFPSYKVKVTRGDMLTSSEIVWVPDRPFVFSDLESDTRYKFKFSTINHFSDQRGNWSEEIEAVTIDRDPKFIPNVSIEATTNDLIRIGWSAPPLELRDRIHQYKVIANHWETKREPAYVNGTTNSYVFENLKSMTSYQLKVAACSIYKTQCADWSTEIEAVTIDRDPNFIPTAWIEATTSNSITFRWLTPKPELYCRVHQYKVIATRRNWTSGLNYSTGNSHVFTNLEPDTRYQLKVAACGQYKTQCSNWSIEQEAWTKAEADESREIKLAIWSSLIVAVVLLIVMFIWMSIRKRREMAARRRFIEATLESFNTGALDCLDPEMNIGDQAELLPYDKNLEIPRKSLKLGKVLGSGAFGVVRRAESRSINRPGKVTTVAVKTVRPTARLHCMTALSRELKILAHLGKHLNVVNLIGACTDKVLYGELWVVVEFCRFGNLHDFLLNRRDAFVDQLVDALAEKVAGTSFTEDGIQVNDSGMDTAGNDAGSATIDCGEIADPTALSVAIDDDIPANDLVEPEDRSKYQGDYADQNVPSICTQDLVNWAWQVSRGMEYLSSRRILHGDLAARNILLADNNVVKICDFGLARALYTDDNYEKKGQDPLPLKWMAIESIRDRVFSVKSDIWSYGIVLWEFFTLAETPYPGIEQENVYQKLTEGFRMAQPKYATEDIYRMMLQCWETDPSKRPSFAELADTIAGSLDENVKMNYMDLSAPYVEKNAEASATGKPDYLMMTSSHEQSSTIEPSLP